MVALEKGRFQPRGSPPSQPVLPGSLLREEPGGWCAPKAGATIEVGHEKKVDLGVLRGADHDGRVPESPFTTVDRVCVEFEVTM